MPNCGWPPMNADKPGWKKHGLSAFISVHRRLEIVTEMAQWKERFSSALAPFAEDCGDAGIRAVLG